MYIQHENIGIGAKLPSEYKLAEIVVDDPLGLAQFEDKYRSGDGAF